MLALDHNGFAGRISAHHPGLISGRVVVVVAGADVVCSVTVVLVCANAIGATAAQAIVIRLFFIILSLSCLSCAWPLGQGIAVLRIYGFLI